MKCILCGLTKQLVKYKGKKVICKSCNYKWLSKCEYCGNIGLMYMGTDETIVYFKCYVCRKYQNKVIV